jgi:hypothetical protein
MIRFLLLALSLVSGVSNGDEIDIHWVYVNENLSWESPPPDLGKAYEYADNSELVVLYPSGEVVRFLCTLHRDRKTHRLSICEGCGFAMQKGTWTSNPDHSIGVKLRWVYRPLKRPEGQQADPEISEIWKIQGQASDRVASVLEAPSIRYLPSPTLANMNFLANAIRVEGGSEKKLSSAKRRRYRHSDTATTR